MSAKADYVALSNTKHMELVCLLHDFKMYSLTKELMRFPLKKANFVPTILPSAFRHFHLIPEHVVYLLTEKMNITKFKVRCERTPCFIAVLYVMHMLYALI